MISIYKDYDDVPRELSKGKTAEATRNRLQEIYHGKCAYSEVKLGPVSETYIHHYRPRILYPPLEFEWSNLLPVSPACARAAGKKFPIKGRRAEEFPEDRAHRLADSQFLLREEPLLLNPETDTPENHLSFSPEGIIFGITEKGRKTIETFELNNSSLIAERKKKVDHFREQFNVSLELFISFGPETEKPDIKGKSIHDFFFREIFKHLKKAAAPQAEFSLVGLYMLQHFDRFFLDYFSPEKETDENRKEWVSRFQARLKEAHALFTKTDDIIKTKKREKKVPLFPKDPARDERMKKGLPYALKSFEIRKYHGIKQTRLEGLPINARWIFLTGENGFGKTLLLQALVMGLYGKRDQDLTLADDNCRITVEFKAKEENRYLIASAETHMSFNLFAAYGPGRLSIDGDVFQGRQAAKKTKKTDSLFQNTPVLSNIQEYLLDLHGRRKFEKKFNTIIETLKKLLPGVEDIIVDDSEEKKIILYRERMETGELLETVPFGALSAGSKSIIAMVGDMLIEFFGHKEADDPMDMEGMVFIDELDVHLHAKWQREFVIRLTETFPKIQFIASTHSPVPLLGAPAETVILNVERKSKKEGITVRRLDVDVTELTPNTIFSSPIFDFDHIISEAHDLSKPLRTQDDYGDVVFDRMLEQRLEKLAAILMNPGENTNERPAACWANT